jgi:hypothetical protein
VLGGDGAGERGVGATQRAELVAQHAQGLVGEPGADVARVDQARRVVDPDEQGADLARTVALAGLVAGHDGFLGPDVLDLAPVVGPDARGVAGVEALGDHAFHAVLNGDGTDGLKVAAGEPGGRLPVRAGQGQLVQQGPALRVLQVHELPAVQLEQVEDQVGHRGLPGQQRGLGGGADVHPRLQGLELRPASGPEHHDLPVEEQLFVSGRRAEPGQLRVGHRDVAFGPGHQAHLALFDVGQGAHAVPLDLHRPAVLVAGRRPGHREHGAQGAGQGQAFPVDHPLAALGLEQHVPAGDALPVQHDLDLAGCPLERLVAAAVPDGDRARAVLAARDLPLEAAVLQGMVLGVHGQVVDRRVGRDALGQGPGHQHPVALETEVPVQAAGVMLLDHERPAGRLRGRRSLRGRDRLGRPRGIALVPVGLQLVHVTRCTRSP